MLTTVNFRNWHIVLSQLIELIALKRSLKKLIETRRRDRLRWPIMQELFMGSSLIGSKS